MTELHEGICGRHISGLSLASKAIHAGYSLMEIKLKWTWRPIIKNKKRLRLKWRTLMEFKLHLKGLQGACSRL